MPLPTDATIHLTAYSRPGETSQSRPKQAMIIRMSDETLDLLESLPTLHFDFSDNSGLSIGDTFFPVTPVQETIPHDLYLRTSSAAKRNAPLKLYANVTGKFTVKERQLDDRITDIVRKSTVNAQNQRAGRTTIFVDSPTDLPPPNANGKRSKKESTSTMFRKPVRPADQPRRPPPTTSAAASPGDASLAPLPPQRSKDALQALRSRMIRCIASADRTSDQVVKLVGGNDCSTSTKRDILELLDEIAEPIPLPNNSKAQKNYRLKTKLWLEVRPYEIPGLSESERTTMARSAKRALHDLKVPESDSAWAHVQYRNPNGTTSNSVSRGPTSQIDSSKVGQGSDPPKRGITSTAAKKEKTSRSKESGEIRMKDESLRSSSLRPPSSSSTRDDDTGRPAPQKPSANRPRPGSGFKAKQPTPTESREFASGRSPVINGKAILGESSSSAQEPRRPPNNNPSQSSERRTSGVPVQKTEKSRRDDVAASDSERSDRVRDRERILKAKEKERERERRERESERERGRERERERERRDVERQRERERAIRRESELESDRERDRFRKKVRNRDWSQEREEGERSDDGYRPPKRRKPRDDDDYETTSRTVPKKRRMDSPTVRNTKPRDLSLPKKPDLDLPPPPKPIKRESPQPARFPKIKKESSKEPTPISKISVLPSKSSSSTSSSQVTSSKLKTSLKRRRGSDIYTSSEDEGEIRPSVKRETASSDIPMTTNNNNNNNNNNNHNRNDVSTQSRSYTSELPPAEDHAALRAHYDTYYLPYLGNFQLLMKHKTKICNLLRKMDKGSSGSVTESDGDGELLDPEELRKLAMEYHNQHEDLENIQRIFSKRD